MKLLYVILTVFIFFGCSTNTPVVSEYRISTNIKTKEYIELGCREKSLKIAQAFSSSDLMTRGMNYAQGDVKRFRFTQSQWAESPNRAVTSELLLYIKTTKLFKNVQISKSRSRGGLLLETNIVDFMQYFSEDSKESHVNVSISLTLIDTKSNAVVSTKTITKVIKVDEISAEGGVRVINEALEGVVVESGEWLSETCK